MRGLSRRSSTKIIFTLLAVAGSACVTPSPTVVKPWHEMEGKTPTPEAVRALEANLPKAKPTPPPREALPEAKLPAAMKASTIQEARVSPVAGPEGGFVVLWPRIIPSKGADQRHALATKLQVHLRSAVTRVAGGRPVDVRPEPERTCPRDGCEGTAAGVLLLHHSRGCAAVGMVTPPGTQNTRLIPLAGRLTLKKEAIPFRDLPESQIVVHDFVPCAELMVELAGNTPSFEKLLRSASGS